MVFLLPVSSLAIVTKRRLSLAPRHERGRCFPLAAAATFLIYIRAVEAPLLHAKSDRMRVPKILLAAAAFSQWPSSAQEASVPNKSADAPLVLNTIDAGRDRAADAPGLSISLDSDALERSSRDHPAEALNTLPSVNIHMNSGQEHLIALRSPVLTGGAGQGSFLILENGIPTRSSAFGNVNALFEPVHEIAADVEVVIGPASAKYGSNAVHGLINFNLPDPGEYPSSLSVSASSLGAKA